MGRRSAGRATRGPASAGVGVDELDGVSHPRWWFNLRASNTEPLLRLDVESVDAGTLRRVVDHVLAVVDGSAPTRRT